MSFSLNNIKVLDNVAEKYKSDPEKWDSLGEDLQTKFLKAYTTVYPNADVSALKTKQEDPSFQIPTYQTQVSSIIDQPVEEEDEIPVQQLTKDEERNRNALDQVKSSLSFEPSIDRDVVGYDGAVSDYERQFRQKEIDEYLKEQKKIDAVDVVMNKVTNPATILPFVGDVAEVSDIYSVITLADKFERGENLTRDQHAKLSEFVNYTGNERTFWGGVAEVLTEMPTFMLEMGMTGGLFNLGKAGLKKGVKTALNKVRSEGFKKKLAKSFLAKKTAKNVSNWVAKTGFQTGLIAESNLDKRVLEETLMYGLSDETEGIMQLLEDDELQADITNYARLDEYIEVISENLGVGFAGLGKIAKRKLLKSNIINAIEKSNPGKSLEVLRKYGYDGVLEEMLEERAGEVLRGGAYKLGLSDDDRLKYELPDRDQLLTELVSFSILPMMTGQPAQNFDKFLVQIKNRQVLDKLNKRMSKTKAGREILRAEKEGGYTFETLQQAKYFVDKNPNYNVESILDFTNKSVEITKKELEKEGRSFEEFGLDKDTERANVLGSTELVEKSEGVLSTLISLNRGADVTTVVEEFAGHFYKAMTPEERTKFTEYYESVVDKGMTELNEQEFFQKSALAYFKVNTKNNQEGLIPIVSTVFNQTNKAFKQAKSLFKQAVGTETASEATTRLINNFLDGKLNTGNLQSSLDAQNFQLTGVQAVANRFKNRTKISPKRQVNKAHKEGISAILNSLNDPNFDAEGALRWYRDAIDETINIASIEEPKIVESYENEVIYKAVLGITSLGTDLDTQYNYSIPAFRDYINTGSFRFKKSPAGLDMLITKNKFGKDVKTIKPAIADKIKFLTGLIDKFGKEGAVDWLLSKHKGEEINNVYKELVGTNTWTATNKKLANTEFYGGQGFGKKLGRFFMNFNGVHEEAVYDMWFARTWYRWMGEPFKRDSKTGKYILDSQGKRILQETPAKPADLDKMDEAMTLIANDLTEITGDNWGVDQVQAVLWYYEKELYVSEGVKSPKGVNYKDVAIERAKREGYYERYTGESTTSEGSQDLAENDRQEDVNTGEESVDNQGSQETTENTRRIRGQNYQLVPTFYSKAHKVVYGDQLKQRLGSNPKVQRIRPALKNLGVTNEELDWLDIDMLKSYSKDGRIKYEYLQDYITENQIDIATYIKEGSDTRYSESNLQLPGSSYNYSEMLLSLVPKLDDYTSYKSAHFKEQNILGWCRYNLRQVDGEKIFFIEEIQSDWHQEGRERGYSKETNFDYKRNVPWKQDYIKLGQRFKKLIDNYNSERYDKDKNKVGDIIPLNKLWLYQTINNGKLEPVDFLSKSDKNAYNNAGAKYATTDDLKEKGKYSSIVTALNSKGERARAKAFRDAGLSNDRFRISPWYRTIYTMNETIISLKYQELDKDDLQYKLMPHELIELDAILDEFNIQSKRYREAEKDYHRNLQLPDDAPFKGKGWQQLVLRKVLRLASEMGVDKVAWTSGKQQIDRYEQSMRQNVDSIKFIKDVDNNRVQIIATKNNKQTFNTIADNDKLAKYVGKDIALKILNDSNTDGEITGKDLSIGGQGMKQAYDENIGNYLKKYTKRWGSKLSTIKLFDQSKVRIAYNLKEKPDKDTLNDTLRVRETQSLNTNINALDRMGNAVEKNDKLINEANNVTGIALDIGSLKGAIDVTKTNNGTFQIFSPLPIDVREEYKFQTVSNIIPDGYKDTDYNYYIKEGKGFDVIYKNAYYALVGALSHVQAEIDILAIEKYSSAGVSFDTTEQQAINITPKLRNSVLYTGQRQFQLQGVKPDVAPIEIPDETLSGVLNRYIFDKLGRLDEIQKYTVGDADPYLKSMLFIGRSSNRIDQFRKNFRKPFIDKLAEAGFSMHDLGDYMYAKHSQERDRHLRAKYPNEKKWKTVNPSGLSDKDRDEIFNKFANTDIDRFAQEVQDNVIKRTLELQLSEGLITQESFDNLENFFENYVPLKGKKDLNNAGQGLGQGFSTPKNVIKRAFGRESSADNPFIQALIDYETAIIHAEKNRVAQELYKLVESNPSDLWEVSGIKHIPRYDKNGDLVYLEPKQLRDDEILVKFDGKAKKIVIKDRGLLKGMKNLGTGYSFKVLRLTNNYLRSVFTNYSPEFIISNFLRDSQTAFMHLSEFDQKKLRAKVFKDIPKAMKGIYAIERENEKNNEFSEIYESFKQQGGKMGWNDVLTVDEKIASLESEMNWDYRGQKGVVGWTKNGFKSFFDYIDALNTSVENAVRLSTYKALVENGETKERSALFAKDITVNFNRKGEIATLMNNFYLFFNAGLQGTNRIYRAFRNSKKIRLMTGALTLTGYLTSRMNRFASPDDYEQYSSYILQNYWMILKENGGAITLRMPYGWNVPVGLGVLLEKLHNEPNYKKDNMFSDVVTLFSNAFSPISGGSGLQTFAPTVTKPFIQHFENKNFMGGMIKKEQSTQRKPEYKMTWDDTPPTLTKISKFLNDKSFGNELEPGILDWNPDVMKHYLTWASGGTGRFMLNSVQALESLSNQEPLEPNNTPIFRQFYKLPSEYKADQNIKEIRYKQLSEVMDQNMRLALEGQYVYKIKKLNEKIASESDVEKIKDLKEEISENEMLKSRSLINYDIDQMIITSLNYNDYTKKLKIYYRKNKQLLLKAYKNQQSQKTFLKFWQNKYKDNRSK